MEKDQNQVLHFEPSAYLQRLLGRELISTEYIAIAELVKNAFDAGATRVEVAFGSSPPRITISDNGLGMSLTEFRQYWMVPGFSEKTEAQRSMHRPLLGEKGIGRFATDKLARKLRVVTKKVREDTALVVDFDWDQFNNRGKKMSEIPIPYFRISDQGLGRNQSGTRLELCDLRKEWTREDWKNLRKQLQNLVSPFKTIRKFEIFTSTESWGSGSVASLFETQQGYTYNFSISKSGRVSWHLTRPKKIARQLHKRVTENGTRASTSSFGPVNGSFYFVDSPHALSKRNFEPGIAVYRDGFRVEPYGRPYNDWLRVKSTKASRQGHAPINPNRLFGFVEISRDSNPNLKDVTNREGLLGTSQFKDFQDFVKSEFDRFARVVGDEKDKTETESRAYQAQRAEFQRETRADAFAKMASQLAHQLRQPLNHIRMSADNLKLLMEKSGAYDNQSRLLSEGIERNILRMDENITNLSKLAEGLKDTAVEVNLCDFVEELANKHRADFIREQVQLIVNKPAVEAKAKLSRVALTFILDNFIENGLSAASVGKQKPGKVEIDLVVLKNSGIRIKVSDNGDGINPDVRDKLFNEAVGSEHGQGIGLFWAGILADEYGGHIGFEDNTPSGSIFYIQFENHEGADENE